MRDARHARSDTVIDEWDEDFDRGKVRRKLLNEIHNSFYPFWDIKAQV